MPRIKEWLRARFPGVGARVAYFLALFDNEIELRLLPILCDRGKTSIDVGAFTGTYSIGALLHSKRVVAVEPQPAQAAALRRAMPSQVEVIEAALSDVAAEGWLEMNTIDGGSMSRVTPSGQPAEGRIAHRVRLMRLDDLTADRVGFVKIDAEGHETEVLQGGLELIRANRPALVIEAEERLQPNAVDRVVAMLRPLDYDAYFVYRGRLQPITRFDAKTHQDLGLLRIGPRRDYADYINNFVFVPRERSAAMPSVVPSAWSAARTTLLAWIGW